MEKKICANCKHYYRITGITPQGSNFCRGVKNIITGSDTPCHYARYDKELCGIEARFFEQKEETPPAAKKKSFFGKLFGNRRLLKGIEDEK